MLRKFGKLGSVGNRTVVQRAISYLRKLNTSPANINDANGWMQRPANLLLNSATPATQSVTCTAQVYTLALIGTGSVALSGTASGTLSGTGASNLVVLSFTPTAGSVTFTKSGSVTSFGLFTGTLSSAQLIAMGGIPLTTSAASVAGYTRANVWDFGVPQGPLAYAATHTAAEFLAAYPAWHLYQDTAGTVPACKITDPVGLCLDTGSGAVVLGPNLVVNGGFDADTDWTKGTGVTISGGKINYAGFTTSSAPTTPIAIKANTGYRVVVTGVTYISGSLSLSIGGVSVNVAGPINVVLQTTTTASLVLTSSAFEGGIGNLTIQEVIGNHASQSTTTKRPILSGRVNLLTATEDFSSASWGKDSAAGGAAPVVTLNQGDGVLVPTKAAKVVFYALSSGDQSFLSQTSSSVTGASYAGSFYVQAFSAGDVGKQILVRHLGSSGYLAVTLTASPQRVSRTEAAASTTGTLTIGLRPVIGGGSSGTVSVYLWYPDLRPANSPTNIPAYQRVTSAADYDTVGFPVRALFDGVDDCLVVPSLDLSMTDKVTVVAGVTVQSNAAAASIVELGASVNSVANSFYIFAADGPNSFEVMHRGNGPLSYSYKTPLVSAPSGVVMSASIDLSGTTHLSELPVYRVNRDTTRTDSGAADTGGGNFRSDAFYIGQRNSTQYPLNGAIQRITLINKLSSDSEVALLEALTNTQMGKVY